MLPGVGLGRLVGRRSTSLLDPGPQSRNLLGREQSGEIAAVGLEMYNQMLRDAVGALRAQLPGQTVAATSADEVADREAEVEESPSRKSTG